MGEKWRWVAGHRALTVFGGNLKGRPLGSVIEDEVFFSLSPSCFRKGVCGGGVVITEGRRELINASTFTIRAH